VAECSGRPFAYNAAPAKKLTKNANLKSSIAGGIPTQPATTLRVFVTALGRLGYDTGALLAASDVGAAQLEDPDRRIPCTSIPAVICEAMRTRPLKNLGVKVASETPIGAFQLLDYLIVTCENVREAAKQLARYLRIREAPFEIEIRDDEDPIRIVYANVREPFIAEFEVALAIFHFRGETESRLTVEYASFTHIPDDVVGMANVGMPDSCPVTLARVCALAGNMEASVAEEGFLVAFDSAPQRPGTRCPLARTQQHHR
jgi:AraC-type transcriptional regulator